MCTIVYSPFDVDTRKIRLMEKGRCQSIKGTTPATCARLNRTTASLDALRFEASAHHQAGSCTQKKGVDG